MSIVHPIYAVMLHLRWLLCSSPHATGYSYILDVIKYLKNSPADNTFLNLGIFLSPLQSVSLLSPFWRMICSEYLSK
ncbi:hypothetical protein M758_9G181200 [Ceratodon purpureus]|nr:hypothetical protein M758_9G181200 [Ceratodon purpureus]